MTDIGLDVQQPEEACEDPNCPFHGTLKVRGQVIEGRVANVKAARTAIIERERLWELPKFDRYEKRTGRYAVHHPPCIKITPGDHVKIAECRPLSKTKSFVIVEARAGKLTVYGQDAQAPSTLVTPADEAEDEEAEDDADAEEEQT
jgi:small subunit ribosomal protein S17